MPKKGVSKDDLKRLMKNITTHGTITHPLAKYNSLGHLICTICNCQVKSDRLWNPHLLSRSHKERASQPTTKQTAVDLATLSSKRKLDSSESPASKKLKETKQKPKGILKNAVPLAGYSSSDEDSVNESDNIATSKKPSTDCSPAPSGDLPADFFDNAPAAASVDIEGDGTEQMDTKPDAELPEGFFDDPVADAKARNVEYVDKDEFEWEKFQSEIKQETHISEQITADDDFVATEERHIEEIDEQLAQWSRVNNIVQRKEELMKHKMEVDDTQEDSSSDTDDLEFNQFLNWRSKKVIK